MADNNKKKPPTAAEQMRVIEGVSSRTNNLVFGISGEFNRKNAKTLERIESTITDIQNKYQRRTGSDMIDYYKNVDFNKNILGEMQKSRNARKDQEGKKKNDFEFNEDRFKNIMTKEGLDKAGDLLHQEQSRIQTYKNYEEIFKNIPQAAQALDIIKDNIMSPDDFTKQMFTYTYNSDKEDVKSVVDTELEKLVEKYDLEEMADDIINKSLIYGDCYISIISIEKEMSNMLNNMNRGSILNESYEDIMTQLSESESFIDHTLYDESVNLSEEESAVMREYLYGTTDTELNLSEDSDSDDNVINLSEEQLVRDVVEVINSNIKILNKKSLLIERAGMEIDKLKNQTMNLSEDELYKSIDDMMKSGKKKKKEKEDEEAHIGINGSSVRVLDPRKVIELKVDNTPYGYYYIESDDIAGKGLGSPSSVSNRGSVNQGGTVDITANNSRFDGGISNMGQLTDAKLDIIKNVFINGIAKKVDKDFVRHNREFKDFIFELVKQRYFLEKKVSLIYFNPSEIVQFKVPSIYRKVLFFSKLFIATMANEILIKMGRGHDKRVFYIEQSPDANVEQSVMQVVQDLKTREFRMDDIGDISTVLNLNPGRFDDQHIRSYVS